MSIPTRTFGIEIETSLPQALAAQFPNRAWRGTTIRNGDGTPTTWLAKSDASIHGGHAVEVVSPPLSGIEGLAEAVGFLMYMADNGGTPNRSQGIHIHVDVRDLNARQRSNLRRLFVRHEKAIFALNGAEASRRWHGSWCRPSHMWSRQKYQSLNTLPFATKGTYEVRCFASTLDDAAVVAFVLCVLGLVEAAKSGDRLPMQARLGTTDAAESLKALLPDVQVADESLTDDVRATVDTLTSAAVAAGF